MFFRLNQIILFEPLNVPIYMTSSKKTTQNTLSNKDFYAIAETSGQQFWFEVDKYYDIDRLNAKEKDKIILDKILLIKEKDTVSIGRPYIKNAKIELEVVSHKRDKKIIVYKMRPKKKTRRKMGHRQELTRVMVKSISFAKASSKTASKTESGKSTPSTKKEKTTN